MTKLIFNLLANFGFIQFTYFGVLLYFHDDLSSFLASEKWSSRVSTGLFLIQLIPFIISLIFILAGIILYKRYGVSLLLGIIGGSLIGLILVRFSINSYIIKGMALLVGDPKVAISILILIFAMVSFYGLWKLLDSLKPPTSGTPHVDK